MTLAQRWGVADHEVSRHFPCDDVVPGAPVQLWRGVTVGAPPEAVWPWVRQLRLAPYSYDWVDNAGRRSPRSLRPLDEPVPGDPFTTVGGRFPAGRVLSAEPGVQLTAEIMKAVMSYVLVPAGPDRTRLLLKLVMAQRHWWTPGLAVGDLVMARKQLRVLASLSEQEGLSACGRR